MKKNKYTLKWEKHRTAKNHYSEYINNSFHENPFTSHPVLPKLIWNLLILILLFY